MYYGAVLAAGLGTRLHPLTSKRPKPLVPLAGRPLIQHALDALMCAGITRVGVNTYHLSEAFHALPSPPGLELSWINEEILQGTGGGVRGVAAALPPGPLVVVNGDALFSFPLAPLIEAHRASGAMGSLVLRRVPEGSPFNRIRLDESGQIHRIAEVIGPQGRREDLVGAAYTGIQIIEPELIAALPDGPCDVLRSAWRQRLNEGASLRGLFAPADSLWLDVGTPSRYLEAHRHVLEGRLLAPWLPAADAQGRFISPDAEVHPTAEISAGCAILAGARIGAGARLSGPVFVDQGGSVAAEAHLSDCVLWPGARATGQAVGEVFINTDAQ